MRTVGLIYPIEQAKIKPKTKAEMKAEAKAKAKIEAEAEVVQPDSDDAEMKEE